MSTVQPFLEGNIAEGNLRVGARYTRNGSLGPVADISLETNHARDIEPSWITISTDAHEGHASLNVEALPHLIKALRQVEKHLKAGRPSPQ